MKKKYLFLFVLLPLLSFGQDTTYAIDGNKLVETITHRVSGVDVPKDRNYTTQSRYWFEKPGMLVVETESMYGDNTVGFFFPHWRWYRDIYEIGKDKVTLVRSEFVSERTKPVGGLALLALFITISLLSYVFDGKNDLKRMWLNSKRHRKYPRLAVLARVLICGTLYLLTYGLAYIYGGDVFFPFMVTTLITVISISVLIVRCHQVKQENLLQFG